jgi:hypothetical protein
MLPHATRLHAAAQTTNGTIGSHKQGVKPLTWFATHAGVTKPCEGLHPLLVATQQSSNAAEDWSGSKPVIVMMQCHILATSSAAEQHD